MKSSDIEDRYRRKLGERDVPSNTSVPSFVGIHPNSLLEIANVIEEVKKTCEEAKFSIKSVQELSDNMINNLEDYFNRILFQTALIEKIIKPSEF